jgi:hypothetical protein
MKRFRSTKRFEKFLKTSLQSSLELTEDQIDLLSPGLSYTQILLAVENAGWAIQRSELLRNGLISYRLRKGRMCSCGEPCKHFHYDEPCCGTEECCPEYPIETDPDIEIASIISRIREP